MGRVAEKALHFRVGGPAALSAGVELWLKRTSNVGGFRQKICIYARVGLEMHALCRKAFLFACDLTRKRLRGDAAPIQSGDDAPIQSGDDVPIRSGDDAPAQSAVDAPIRSRDPVLSKSGTFLLRVAGPASIFSILIAKI